MNKLSIALLGAVLVALAVVAYVVLNRPPPVPEAAPPTPAPVETVPAPAPAEPPSAPASAAAPQEPASVASALPPLAADDAAVKDALIGLLGKPAVLTLLQTDGFAQRVAATVDNLPRRHVAPRLWPVNPTEGRFTVDDQGHIAPANADRYAAFVRLVESVRPAEAAALYRRLAPQLQKAYEELGYPSQRFRDRLVEVLDHLLATPTVTPPLAVQLTQVKGPVASERPWVRYEYADPSLESLSAGQRILLRTGDVNQRRLMAWLRAFRSEITR